MKLKEAIKKAEESIEETLACCDFPSEHWARIHINNAIERLNREIRRHNRRVGSFPMVNLPHASLRTAAQCNVAGVQWGNRNYMNMKHLRDAIENASITG